MIFFTPEREEAEQRYEKKFGKKIPLYYPEVMFPYDPKGEVAFIDKCILENKPAPDIELDPDILL